MSSLKRLLATPFSVLMLVMLLLQVAQPSNCCTCVAINLCADNEIGDDEVVVNPRSGGSNGQCTNYLEVCCNNVKGSPKSPLSIPNKSNGCGYRNHHGIGFRTTGDTHNEAAYGEFPWMVAILKSDKKNYIGVGSLIHPKVVLTAAHLVYNENINNLVIRAGEWDLESTNEMFPSEDIQVSKIIIHDQFQDRDENNRQVLYNDVALIIVVKEFLLSKFVNTVCLPSQNFEFESSKCYSGGWGKDKFGLNGYYQRILKRIDLPTVQRNLCLEMLKKTRLPIFSLHQSYMCAGGVIGKDTCTGDGGSPLVCPLGNEFERYQQAGIVSWGIKCASETPGVYTNVPLFRDWIDDQMTNENLETSYYTP